MEEQTAEIQGLKADLKKLQVENEKLKPTLKAAQENCSSELHKNFFSSIIASQPPVLEGLCWLPVKQQLHFRLALLVFKSMIRCAPTY